MQGLPERFLQYIYKENLFNKKNKLLLAVSGGVDSVVLCKLCHICGFNFGIAHCNFQLRGEESDRDEAFVKELAERLQRPFYSVRFDTKAFAAEHKYATQEAARILRYDWFEKVRAENDYDFIVTAHHADDNIETVLMNFFRGTGIRGVSGMKPRNGKILRPLLFAKRKDLEDFQQAEGLSFVQDNSNLSNDYTRNFFRNTILPLIAQKYPEVQDNLLDNIERFKEAEILYQHAIAQYRKKLLQQNGEDIYIPVLLLQKTPAVQTILLELLRPYDFKPAQLPDILGLLYSESGKYVLSSTLRILRDRKHLILSRLQEVSSSPVVIEQPGNYVFANGTLSVKHTDATAIPTDPKVACIDASAIQFPLLLRPWRTGDYFYPLGMSKKKKLSRFFIDNKLSMADKEKVWVVEMNKKIIWVVGYRIDDRFKIKKQTTSVLRLEWK